MKNKQGKSQLQLLLVTTLLCLSLVLTGCNGKDLTHVNDAFNGKPIKVQKAMADETSHMANTASTDANMAAQNNNPAQGSVVVSENKTSDNETIASNNEVTNSLIRPVPERPKPQNFNNKNIFSDNLKTDSVRLDRLERAVQDMRNDFDNVAPSIRRLMAIEGDIQNLISELKKVNEGVGSANTPIDSPPQSIVNTKPIGRKMPPVVAEPIETPKTASTYKIAPIPKTENKIVTKTPPPAGDKPAIYDVRVGEHPGKTRIVMDVNSKTDFSVDIDNNEKIMIVEFPKAAWDASTARTFANSPYITSYKAEPSAEGTLAIFQLKRAAKIAYKDDLKGEKGQSRRVVIDVTNN